jgi:hypothetical protein
MNPIKTQTVRFSFCQLQIYDKAVHVPACVWTPAHISQGFVRRASTASFATILDTGDAPLRLFLSPLLKDMRYDRVICVPFYAQSGDIGIGAPDDWPHQCGFKITAGHYRLCVAQRLVDEEKEIIDLFFEKLTQPATKSDVVVGDANLKPTSVLLEDSPEPT